MNRELITELRNTPAKIIAAGKKWLAVCRTYLRTMHGNSLVLVVALGVLAIAGLHVASTTSSSNPVAAPTTATQSPAQTAVAAGQTQSNPLFATHASWYQDFAGKTTGPLDPASWNVLIGPAENSNREQQYYTDSAANIRIENGALRLIATKQAEPAGYQYGSARIETQDKQSFLYGRMDIVAKLPHGAGTWPAVWLLPANDIYEQKSPASDPLRYRNGGEIDILEAVGFQQNKIYGIAHTAQDFTSRSDGTGSYSTVDVPTSTTDFNTYTLLWTPTTMTFEVNGTPYFTYARKANADYTSWPFDQPFYLIVNLAMGGSWGGMDTAHFPDNGIDASALPASLDIRSIYYYPYIGPR